MAIRYVDSSVATSGNGQSWATAWKNLTNITGLVAGDTVFISGGPSGSTQTYSLPSGWTPTSGSSGSRITYQIGQDASHNGTAIFATGGSNLLIGTFSNINFIGDAGDGLMHFQHSSTSRTLDINSNCSNWRLGYLNVLPDNSDFFIHFNWDAADGIEIDHCRKRKLDAGAGGADAIMYLNMSIGQTGFDRNLIHHNQLFAPSDINGPGDGDDFIQGIGDCVSVYNNSFIAQLGTYTNGQHQDGIQPLHCNWVKFYNNYCQDIGNYAVFGDAYVGDINHFWVYNNIIVIVTQAVRNFNPQGIAIGPDGGVFGNLGRWPLINDVIVCNNLIADYGPTNGGINLGNGAPRGSTPFPGGVQRPDGLYYANSIVSNCVCKNNVIINGGGLGLENYAPTGIVAQSNNLPALSLATGAGHFVNYVASQVGADFHLVSGDTTLLDKGVSLASFFASDKDGISRPQGAAWDIGPYEFASSSPYPLRQSANKRYLVNQSGLPVLLFGSAPHCLFTKLNTTDLATFFAARAAVGINIVWAEFMATLYVGGNSNGATYDGIVPFPNANLDNSTGDLSTINPAYLARVDAIVNQAATYGICILFDVFETGQNNGALLANAASSCHAYGQALGSHYKNFPNIIWILGNDYYNYADPAQNNPAEQIMLGIQQTDPNHLQTIQLSDITIAYDNPQLLPYCGLSGAYTYRPTYYMCILSYNGTPTMPSFMEEANYEGENNTQQQLGDPLCLRRQMYWSLTTGQTGYIYGNHYEVYFASGWPSNLSTVGTAQLKIGRDLFNSFNWWTLIPDQSNQLLVGGFGTRETTRAGTFVINSSNYCTAAADSLTAATLAVVYVLTPSVTINLAKFAGTVTAQWFDPANGTYHPIGSFSASGTRAFPIPGNNNDGATDWLLLLQLSGGGGGITQHLTATISAGASFGAASKVKRPVRGNLR